MSEETDSEVKPNLVLRITPIDADATLELRQSVLWPSLSVADVLLAEDHMGLHFGAFVSQREKPIAVISLFNEPLPGQHLIISGNDSPSQRTSARFRKFACDLMYQNHGIGTKLLQHAAEAARSTLGASIIWCDARTSSSAWYKKRGMVEFGDLFYKGDVEYIRMQMSLDADTCKTSAYNAI
ncbi:acyl-CoA N-acyltransferase [Suillus clintonianus]|uniref:acyl-CoA N-acyltransferase n=1 Tax=Suillus clintonianus TaxID=1904413 RepID=UPI001B880AE8|nr:acyl-CoA N-acyltransferase [Suillus clintonianus]KAG2124593.1 acyl-CoA N-acyltransferase [Suillus clintonianus]